MLFRSVTSELLTFNELSSLTKLQSTSGWTKGDKRRLGNSLYDFSSIHFEPNPEPDEFEDKLKKLIDFLDQDKEGVGKLVEKAEAAIQVATIFHNGNTVLGGHQLDKAIIKRLGSYNLGIDFDLYAEGKFFVE